MSKDIWWKNASIYQVWPASFKDSNGDGIGDIPGVVEKLDYIKQLGIDVLWLSPMFDSPQDDMGYDVSDYQAVYSKYGTIEDMEKLITGCHDRGMKCILDLVVNHTSSEHAWFKESRSSKDSPKRDWYIWKKPRFDEQGNPQPPNNWKSCFSGPAWDYDEATGEYYLHLFAKTQPDLNWENPDVRKAIHDDVMKFWYDKGVDGFRVDTAGLYSKPKEFADAPIVIPGEYLQPPYKIVVNGPRIHEYHKEMNKITSSYGGMTVGEVGHCAREEALKYVSAKENELNMLFMFDLVTLGSENARFENIPFTLKDVKQRIQNQCDFTKGTDAWSTVFIENHDSPRSVHRFGSTKSLSDIFKSSKLIAMLQTTLSGTIFIYQGQEIAMTNLPRSWDISEFKDIESINAYDEFLETHGITADDPKVEEFLDALGELARDHARSPVQWLGNQNAGFSTGDPWMKVHDNYKEINVEAQLNDPESVFNFYKKSLDIRKEYRDLFIHGDFEILDFDNEKTFTYVKTSKDDARKLYCVFNFSDDEMEFKPLIDGSFTVVNSNVTNNKESLSPWEGRVYIVE